MAAVQWNVSPQVELNAVHPPCLQAVEIGDRWSGGPEGGCEQRAHYFHWNGRNVVVSRDLDRVAAFGGVHAADAPAFQFEGTHFNAGMEHDALLLEVIDPGVQPDLTGGTV